VVLDRYKLQDDLKQKVNDRLKVRRTSGKVIDVKVTEVSESSVIMDGNHPLAGEELTFEIHLIEIV
jgi:peptidylprolyl isomerase